MKIEITLDRDDLFIINKDIDVEKIDIFDFASLTRDMILQADTIKFRHEVKKGVVEFKTLKERD